MKNILIISDKYETEMAKEMFNSKIGLKNIYFAPEAGHAKSINIDVNQYEKAITDFCNDVIKR